MSSKNISSAFVVNKAENETGDNFGRQGSFRRLLPANNSGDTQLAMSAKMIERPVNNGNNKEYAIFLQEYNILSEYNLMQKQDLKGIYVIPSAQNSYLWFGVIFVRQGIYQGGVYRFTITLPQNFPEGGCPKVVFQSNLFHPAVNPDNGELNTSVAFPEWKRSNKICQLVQYIVRIFIKLDTKVSGFNEEAIAIFDSDPDNFLKLVKANVTESLSHVNDPPLTDDPHYITFERYDKAVHDAVKEQIYKPKEEEENKALGFSWVEPGSLQPFSKSETR